MIGPTTYDDDLLFIAFTKANRLDSEKGVANGIPTLDENGVIPLEQLPVEVAADTILFTDEDNDGNVVMTVTYPGGE